jgi:hypothetical protein
MKLSLLWLVGLSLVLPDSDLIGFEVKRLKKLGSPRLETSQPQGISLVPNHQVITLVNHQLSHLLW